MPNGSFGEVNILEPVNAGAELFIAGMSLFELTVFEPPLQRVTVTGVNLPDPDTFGPFDQYSAEVMTADGDPVATLILQPTSDQSVWAGTAFLDFGGTIPPLMTRVLPLTPGSYASDSPILEGPLFGDMPE